MFSLPYSLSVSKKIKAPKAAVREHLQTFEAQQVRSPWMIAERDAKVWLEGTDGEVGTSSHREGKIVGAGYQTYDEITAEEWYKSSIVFLKPRKSKAKAAISLSEQNGETTITRTLQSSLPFFLFWMKGTIVAMVSKDFERGLTMLKTLVETGKLATETKYEGEVLSTELLGIGIQNACHESKIGEAMSTDMTRLGKFVEENNIQATWAFAIYPKVDMKKGMFTFVSCVAIDPQNRDSITLADNMSWYALPATKALKVTHRGSYDFLPNSRAAIYSASMNLKKKPNKKISPYEIYTNDPCDTDPKDLVTEIYLPIH